MDRLRTITRRIRRIKCELTAIGDMRPGSLSQQSRSWGGTYWQLSYTHGGKGRTEYVREEDLARVQQQVANYRRWRELMAEWVDLALQRCQLKGDRRAAKAGGRGAADLPNSAAARKSKRQ